MIAIAAARHPGRRFLAADAAALRLPETSDYVMIPDVIEHLADFPGTFGAMRGECHPGTRAVLTCVNPLWAPVLHLAERLKMKMPEGDHRWLPKREIVRLAGKQGLTLAVHQGRILLPKNIPFFSSLLNRLAEKVDWLAPVCLTHVYIFTPGGPR